MNRTLIFSSAALLAAAASFTSVSSQQNEMSFFITSVGSGDGANLGGLSGADAHCQQLAEASGSSGKTWRAYLSAMVMAARLQWMPETGLASVPGTMPKGSRSLQE